MSTRLDSVQPGRVQPQDLPLGRFGELRVAVLLAQRLGNLEPPQRLDLPLRRPVPDRIRPEHDPVLAHELQELAQDVRRDRRERHHRRRPRRADLGIAVRQILHELGVLRRPTDVRHAAAQLARLDLLQRVGQEEVRLDAGVVGDEVELRPVARRFGQVVRMAALRDRAGRAPGPCGRRCC